MKKHAKLIAVLLLVAMPVQGATVTYDKARMSVEGTKKLIKGSIIVGKDEVIFKPSSGEPPSAIYYTDIIEMTTSQRKKKMGGATAGAVLLFGPAGFAMLAANKKYTMVTIETENDLITIGVRKKTGAEFMRRLEKASGKEIDE